MADLPPYFESLMRFYTHQPRQHGHGRAFSPGTCIVYPNFDGPWHSSFSAFPSEQRESTPPPMTLERFKEVLELTPRRSLVQISGGSPLHSRWIRRGLAEATRSRRIALLTGGRGIHPDDASLVTGRAAEGIVSPGFFEIDLTLFGDEQAHDEAMGHPGTYAAAVEELAEIRRQRQELEHAFPRLSLRYLLTPESTPGLGAAWSLARDLKLDHFTIALEDRGPWFEPSSEKGVSVMENAPAGFPRGAGKAAAAQVKAVLATVTRRSPRVRITQGVGTAEEVGAYFAGTRDASKYECPLPWYWFFVDPKGDAYICPRYKVGNVFKEELADVWNGGRARAFRKALASRGSFPACAGCPGLRLKKAGRGAKRPAASRPAGP